MVLIKTNKVLKMELIFKHLEIIIQVKIWAPSSINISLIITQKERIHKAERCSTKGRLALTPVTPEMAQ